MCRALAGEWTAEPDLRTLLGRVEAGLASASRKAGQTAEQKRKQSYLDEARELEARREAMTPEERARVDAIKAGIAASVKSIPA